MTRRLLILILALASCACNRSRNIPDDELVAITRDIFLSNAFRESLLSGIPMTDSVDIYTPIFEKYGYEPEDFNYTVRNLSKRKSVRFTDIIDEVTASLAREDSLLQKRVALLDTIDRRIDERYRQTVYEDSSRRVVRRSGTSRHRSARPSGTLPGGVLRVARLVGPERFRTIRPAHGRFGRSAEQFPLSPLSQGNPQARNGRDQPGRPEDHGTPHHSGQAQRQGQGTDGRLAADRLATNRLLSAPQRKLRLGPARGARIRCPDVRASAAKRNALRSWKRRGNYRRT